MADIWDFIKSILDVFTSIYFWGFSFVFIAQLYLGVNIYNEIFLAEGTINWLLVILFLFFIFVFEAFKWQMFKKAKKELEL